MSLKFVAFSFVLIFIRMFLGGNTHIYQLHDNDTVEEKNSGHLLLTSLLSPWWSAKPSCTKRGMGNQRQFHPWIDIKKNAS